MMIGTRLLLAALLTTFCALDARGEITFAIGEPAEGAVKSGVGLISGWAVSDIGIVSVEAFIDGESIGRVSERVSAGAPLPNLGFWYTYDDDGNQRWFVLQGVAAGDQAELVRLGSEAMYDQNTQSAPTHITPHTQQVPVVEGQVQFSLSAFTLARLTFDV